MTERTTARMGTRGSALARWQTDFVGQALQDAWPNLRLETEVFTTKGDKVLDTPLPLVGGKGLFTAELEASLRGGSIDIAVHSLKDLPTEMPDGLALGAIPQRVNPADALVSRNGYTLESLPHGATIGTSSTRRAAQLLKLRPDLKMLDIRGNVDTRLKKAADPDGPYDAIILAHAGLERLGLLDAVTQVIPLDVMLPAPGQGALGVQCREETDSLAMLEPINNGPTRAAVIGERAFLAALGGGCSVPIAAYGEIDGDTLVLKGRVSALNGSRQIDVVTSVKVVVKNVFNYPAAYEAGAKLARQALADGAADILEMVD